MLRGPGARLRLTAALLWGVAALVPAGATARDLRLASWNLEWLVSTATTREARNACVAGARPRLPCDVALDQARSATDFAALARLARDLDADVIAIQEVESIEVAAQVFPGYRFCLSEGRVVQNLGFAIRRGLPYRCEADLRELSQGEHLRRGVVLSLREQPYVDAAVAAGTRTPMIILRHILPNTLAPLTVQATFICAAAMITEAILSFIGAGTPPIIPSWGNIMAEGRALWQVKPYIVFFPAIFLSVTVLAVNLLGDGLSDALDPRMAKRL